jgi:hypothetical protein
MAFTEKQSYKIEVYEDFSLGVRRSDIVLKDEVEVGRTYHRSVFVPGSDVSAEHPEVQAIAAAVWTPDVVAAYEAALLVVEDGTESA